MYVVHKAHHVPNAIHHKNASCLGQTPDAESSSCICEPMLSESSLSLTTRSSIPQSLPWSKKQHIIGSIDILLTSFPNRKKKPKQLHVRVNTEQSGKDCCIYCSVVYHEKKQPGGVLSYGKEVYCTALH
eukprot:11245047-Ditylum_brightwellii.AAC.1